VKKITDFQKQYIESLRAEELEELKKFADEIYSFKEFFKNTGIELNDNHFKYYRTSGIIATYPNIVGYLHESLKKDKEGLLNFNMLLQVFEKKGFVSGYLYASNFMLMAHPYFRRGFHQINNFSPRFIELFWGINDEKIEKYIALDFDNVRINIDDSRYMEADTWFGAQFNREIQNVVDGIVKLRPPLDIKDFHVSFFFASVYSLDIKWSTKDQIKSFQAEEFKTEDVKIIKDGNEYFPARYIHAEFDISSGYFRHFDGAIHFYTADEYYKRRDSDFNYNSKNSNHIKTLSEKLFKMNGVVTVETWIKFVSHFFTGNPLVFEYFEGDYPQYIKELLDKIRLSN
jgi:hypothetical protein